MDFTTPAAISIPTMIFNLLLSLLLSVLMAVYYTKLGDSLSNRAKFSPILPTLTLITLLVISIVKSSLALSLGLVGALSIVRFRTAIKDPEELIFLFFAIAIGLGMGADQRIPTLIAFSIIMAYLLLRKLISKSLRLNRPKNLYLNISLPSILSPEVSFDEINAILSESLESVDLRRFDVGTNEMMLVYYFETKAPEKIARICSRIKEKNSDAKISFVEQNNLLGG